MRRRTKREVHGAERDCKAALTKLVDPLLDMKKLDVWWREVTAGILMIVLLGLGNVTVSLQISRDWGKCIACVYKLLSARVTLDKGREERDGQAQTSFAPEGASLVRMTIQSRCSGLSFSGLHNE